MSCVLQVVGAQGDVYTPIKLLLAETSPCYTCTNDQPITKGVASRGMPSNPAPHTAMSVRRPLDHSLSFYNTSRAGEACTPQEHLAIEATK